MKNKNKNSVMLSSTTMLQETNQNILVVGYSGSGKTLCYVSPNLLQFNGSYIVVDLGRVLLEKTRPDFKLRDYQIEIFDVNDTSVTDVELFDVASIGQRPTIVYIEASFNREINAKIVPLLIQKIFKTFVSPTKIPVHVFLDEFCNIGEIPEFNQLLALTSSTISCSIIIQSITQLYNLYPETWTSIVSNCDTTVYLGGSERNTLIFISSLSQYIISPESIKYLNCRDCCIKIKGRAFKIDKKYDPFKNL